MRSLALLAAAALSLAVAPPAAAQAIAVGHSGWEWSNPLPQGNSLAALDFTGSHGFAAGSFGTVLETVDGGASWNGVATGVTEDLVDVRMIDDDSLVVAGGCAVRRSDDAGASFRRLPWTALDSRCRAPVAALDFPSADVGYLLIEDGRTYRSGDGGLSWNRMADLPGTLSAQGEAEATDLAFLAADEGLASTGSGIYRTTDGGLGWTEAAKRPGGFGSLATAGHAAYASGGAGALWKSVDSGRNWAALLGADGLPALGRIACSGGLECLVTAVAGDHLLRTRDGGLGWSWFTLPPRTAVAVPLPDGRAVAVGGGGAIARSADGGATWAALGSALPGRFTRLTGGPDRLAFALGEHGLVARSDAGRSWSVLAAAGDQDVADVSFASERLGYLLDGSGSLYRSENGGASWRALVADSRAQSVLALDDERVLLVGPRGIRVSGDGGVGFHAVARRAVRRASLFEIDRAGGWLFAHGPTALFGSNDGGRRWRKLRRPDHRPLGSVDFVDARTGFALGKGGRVWRTRTRGRHWRELLAGTDGASGIAFAGPREGFLAAPDLFFARGARRPDYVLRTTDGGLSWRPQLVADSRQLNGLVAGPGGDGFLLAGQSQLFATTSGGDRGRPSTLRLRASRRSLRRVGKVVVSGRLSPARGGEQLVVARTAVDPRRRKGSTDWDYKSVRVREDGSFRSTWRVGSTSAFVAQWVGDEGRAGAGSRALRVRVAERRR